MEQKSLHPVIVITGLDGSGKTTFLHRIKTGSFKADLPPTIGYEIAIIYKDGVRFDIIDLGGHEAFRKTFWKNFVSSCHGCIFIFDSTDKERLEQAKEWLWKVEDWLSKDASFAFFANKSDLKNKMTLEDIIDGLELIKFSEKPHHSFRIFETSNLTGNNINEAWNWLTDSILRKLESKKFPRIYAFEVYDELLQPLVKVIFDHKKEKELEDIISVFRSHSLKMIEELPAIVVGDLIALILRKGDFYSVTYVDKEDNMAIAREIALTLFFESLAKIRREQEVRADYLKEVIATITI